MTYFMVSDKEFNGLVQGYAVPVCTETELYKHMGRGGFLHQVSLISEPISINTSEDIEAIQHVDGEISYNSAPTLVVNTFMVNSIGLVKDYSGWNNPEFCHASVFYESSNIQYVKEQTEELIRRAIADNGWNLGYIRETNEVLSEVAKNELLSEVAWQALRTNGSAIKFIKNPSLEMIEESILHDGNPIIHVLATIETKFPSEKRRLLLQALSKSGSIIRHIPDHDLEMALTAVSSDGDALEYLRQEFKTLGECIDRARAEKTYRRFMKGYTTRY